jgi:hypothetical protein
VADTIRNRLGANGDSFNDKRPLCVDDGINILISSGSRAIVGGYLAIHKPGTWKGSTMITRRMMVFSLTAGTLFATGLPALAKSRHVMFDTDNDGTVDLAEAQKAGAAAFDKLERDNDGTLDKHELTRRLSAAELAAADPDHDGTLSKDEYLAVVEQRFKAADRDNDGTLDARELNGRAGRALLRLLK